LTLSHKNLIPVGLRTSYIDAIIFNNSPSLATRKDAKLAKVNYQYEKRQKELEKKRKKEQKEKLKQLKKNIQPKENQEMKETPQVQPPEK
jgi:predicted amidophosphoribosyltransferase